MGHIRQRNLKNGGTRYQAEVRMKGHRTRTATFDRKTDARAWIQKTESDIRGGRHQLYSEAKRHTFKEAVEPLAKFKPKIVHNFAEIKNIGEYCTNYRKQGGLLKNK